MSQRILAMKEVGIGIACICMSKSYVVFDNGVVLPICAWLDGDHEPTEDIEEAQFMEFGDDETGYGTLDIDMYDMPSYEHH